MMGKISAGHPNSIGRPNPALHIYVVTRALHDGLHQGTSAIEQLSSFLTESAPSSTTSK